jgi:hypothetical protein
MIEAYQPNKASNQGQKRENNIEDKIRYEEACLALKIKKIKVLN